MRCQLRHTRTDDFFDHYQCVLCDRTYIIKKGRIPRRLCLTNFKQRADRFFFMDDATEGWKFLYLTENEQRRFSKPLEVDNPDDSKVGSWLKETFNKMGYRANASCHCKTLASMLDQASWELIHREQKLVCQWIQQSASKMGVDVSEWKIRAILKLALHRTRNRAKNRDAAIERKPSV